MKNITPLEIKVVRNNYNMSVRGLPSGTLERFEQLKLDGKASGSLEAFARLAILNQFNRDEKMEV